MNLKNITEVALKSTPELTENVIVEDNGVAKRVPMSAIKTGGGAGVDLIFTGVINEQEGSGGDGEYIYFMVDPETLNLETSLSFDELKEKWYYFTTTVAFDGLETGYTIRGLDAPTDPPLYFFLSNFTGPSLSSELGFQIVPMFNIDAEQAANLSNIGIEISVGDDAFLFGFDAYQGVNVPESGDDSTNYDARIQGYIILTKGSQGEIVVNITQGN